jgi:hypothetical protein
MSALPTASAETPAMPMVAAPGLRPPTEAWPPVPALTWVGVLPLCLVTVTSEVSVTLTVFVTVAAGEAVGGGEAVGDGETLTDVETLTDGEALTDVETLTDGEGLSAANRAPFVGFGSDWLRVDCASAAAAIRAPRRTTTAPPMVAR